MQCNPQTRYGYLQSDAGFFRMVSEAKTEKDFREIISVIDTREMCEYYGDYPVRYNEYDNDWQVDHSVRPGHFKFGKWMPKRESYYISKKSGQTLEIKSEGFLGCFRIVEHFDGIDNHEPDDSVFFRSGLKSVVEKYFAKGQPFDWDSHIKWRRYYYTVECQHRRGFIPLDDE